MEHDLFKKLTNPDSWNRSSLLFFAGILGVFLLLGGSHLPNIQSKSESDAVVQNSTDQEVYTQQLEQKLTRLLSKIAGAGEIQVAVTLESSSQTVYALDEKSQQQTGSQEYEHILLEADGRQQALVEMVWEPEIRGIAVVCQGAQDVRVQTQITEAISVLTGVSANRISIATMS